MYVEFNLASEVVTALQVKLVYMSGTKAMAAIVSESWWQMLQFYKPFLDVYGEFQFCL